jgi:molybdopterin synthase catalytic subunit
MADTGVDELSHRIELIEGPLPREPLTWPLPGGAGALVRFDGIVRPLEEGRPLAALHYEAYQPMATRMIHRIATELIERYGLLGMFVEHSIGGVAVGECSFRLRVASPHRKEALAAADEFIDRLKRDVPIWKSAGWSE